MALQIYTSLKQLTYESSVWASSTASGDNLSLCWFFHYLFITSPNYKKTSSLTLVWFPLNLLYALKLNNANLSVYHLETFYLLAWLFFVLPLHLVNLWWRQHFQDLVLWRHSENIHNDHKFIMQCIFFLFMMCIENTYDAFYLECIPYYGSTGFASVKTTILHSNCWERQWIFTSLKKH